MANDRLYQSAQRSGITGRKSYLPMPKYALGLTRPPTQPMAAPIPDETLWQPPYMPQYSADPGGGGTQISREDVPGEAGINPGPFSPGEIMTGFVAGPGAAISGIGLKKGIEAVTPLIRKYVIGPAARALGFDSDKGSFGMPGPSDVGLTPGRGDYDSRSTRGEYDMGQPSKGVGVSTPGMGDVGLTPGRGDYSGVVEGIGSGS